MNTKFYTLVALLATTLAGFMPAKSQTLGPVTDTIYMGASYNNEVYYSMATGNKGAVNRKQWDIAFRASRQSARLETNSAPAVMCLPSCANSPASNTHQPMAYVAMSTSSSDGKMRLMRRA